MHHYAGLTCDSNHRCRADASFNMHAQRAKAYWRSDTEVELCKTRYVFNGDMNENRGTSKRDTVEVVTTT